MAEGRSTAGGAKARRVRRAGAVMLEKSGRGSSASVSIAVRAKAFASVARERGPMKVLIETYGEALERSRRTGEAIRFVVAVEPRGRPKITTLDDAPPPDEKAPPQDLHQALEAARARGLVQATAILSGDDMLSADQFAKLIGTSRMTVNTKRQNHQVLGLNGAKRGFRFPAWQIGEDGKPFDALPALFERLGGAPWTVYRFLIQPHPELDGLTGREALRRGRASQALEAAESIAQGNFA